MRRPDVHSEEYELWLFGAKRCSICGEDFAANEDYFAPDKTNHDRLSCRCRNCRRSAARKRYGKEQSMKQVRS
ncbi:MAG: hypothetical protein ABFE13_11885 [Phycisphaerales bacterium]